jgi:hypothetical protein
MDNCQPGLEIKAAHETQNLLSRWTYWLWVGDDFMDDGWEMKSWKDLKLSICLENIDV